MTKFFEDVSDLDVWLVTPGRYDNVYISRLTDVNELTELVTEVIISQGRRLMLVIARDQEEAFDQAAAGFFVRTIDALEFLEVKYHKDPKRMNPRSNPDYNEAEAFMLKHLNKLKKHVNNPKLLPNKRKLLGCGFMGCVYQTHIPEIAVKFTALKAEADFAMFAIEHPHEGIVPFFDVMKINDNLSDFHVGTHAIWRLCVTDVGEAPESIKLAAWDATRDADEVLAFIDEKDTSMIEEFARKLKQTLEDLKHMAIGRGLTYYLDHGWILNDLHSDNIGRDDKGEWVAFDFIPTKIPNRFMKYFK